MEAGAHNSMTLRTAFWLVAAFVMSFFAVGFPYWQMPYATVSLPSSLYGMGLVMVGVLAVAACAIGKARLLTTILAVGAAVPAAILVRIAVDTAKDPTSHNLWPFELIIAAVIGVLCSTAGGLIGSMAAMFSRRKGTV